MTKPLVAEHLTEAVSSQGMDRSKPVYIEVRDRGGWVRIPLTLDMFEEETNEIVLKVDWD